MTLGRGIKPETVWWEASTHTTVTFKLPHFYSGATSPAFITNGSQIAF